MKLFANALFRWIFYFTVIVITILCPLCFGLPYLGRTNGILLSVATAIVAVVEIIIFISVEYKVTVGPMRTLSRASKKLASGEYSARVDLRRVDNDVKSLALGVNNVANEIEETENARKAFVSNASHELRSPLTSIQGFLQAMLDGTIPEGERDKYLQIVLNESKRLSGLISTMLDLSRLESGSNPPVLSKFDINTVIEDVVKQFAPALAKRNMRVETQLGSAPISVYADTDKIVQVLINLIDNAVKYSPDSTCIRISTEVHGQKVYVSVKDQGCGIGKRDQQLIWDRFYMADKARTPSQSKGTGLGLSIVKRIIEDHNETIWVESNKGSGSVFIFTLTLWDASESAPAEEQQFA